MAFPVFILCLLGLAFGGGPDQNRSLQWPYGPGEFSTAAPSGADCGPATRCATLQNRVPGYWLSPGIEGLAAPGTALVVEQTGIVSGVYVGAYAQVGVWHDEILDKEIPAILGDFRPAIRPGGMVYWSPPPYLVTLRADVISFRQTGTKELTAYDVRLGRVVHYYSGVGEVEESCSIMYDRSNDTWARAAAILPGDCDPPPGK